MYGLFFFYVLKCIYTHDRDIVRRKKRKRNKNEKYQKTRGAVLAFVMLFTAAVGMNDRRSGRRSNPGRGGENGPDA